MNRKPPEWRFSDGIFHSLALQVRNWLYYYLLMVKEIQKGEKTVYQCEECGFHYEDREWAEKCEKWCRERHSCNIDITSHSEEDKAARANPAR